MKLIIVESPTKAKTIAKFVDKKYKIESSYGHIRDLPKSEMGVDTENDFAPKYVIPPKNSKNISNLKKIAEKADEVVMATDEDREGEAIAWHLAEALKLKTREVKRIVFHEITKDAILDALKNPRTINMDLVDAQQARRVLDRLVGYELSPFLWKKVARGLSAGRVQSVAVRLIVEREREIEAFKPDEYWSIEALLSKLDQPGVSEDQAVREIRAKLHKIKGKTLDKLAIKNEAEAKKILAGLKGAEYVVAQVDTKQKKKAPPRPFTTSSLQQTANRFFGFSAKQTMVIAQQLYENGHITYMRTDSQYLSPKFLADVQKYLHSTLGEKYALVKPKQYKTSAKGAQEAHEAVRPAEAGAEPDTLADKLNTNQLKLYRLVWQRSLASQMPAAVFDATAIDIDAGKTEYQFHTTGQVIVFDGYQRIYPEKSKEVELPLVKKGEKLEFHDLIDEQHFTKPPARYSDAGLVRILEKYGIGRPSTYAPTISTIIDRNYVNRDENKRLAPTDIARVVNDLLVAHFPKIVDYEFTAVMETDLDRIAAGEKKWQPVIKDYYEPFHANLETKQEEIKKTDIMPEEKSEVKCDKCGADMIIKTGRYGKFLACSAYPDCKNIKGMNGADGKNAPEKSEEIKKLEEKYAGEKCEKCGSDMILRQGKFGPFLGCSGYPKCKNLKNIKENDSGTGVKCPNCGQGEIVKRFSRKGVFYGCDKYPDCKTAFWGKPTGDKCPDCGSLLIEAKGDTVKCSSRDCGYEK